MRRSFESHALAFVDHVPVAIAETDDVARGFAWAALSAFTRGVEPISLSDLIDRFERVTLTGEHATDRYGSEPPLFASAGEFAAEVNRLVRGFYLVPLVGYRRHDGSTLSAKEVEGITGRAAHAIESVSVGFGIGSLGLARIMRVEGLDPTARTIERVVAAQRAAIAAGRRDRRELSDAALGRIPLGMAGLEGLAAEERVLLAARIGTSSEAVATAADLLAEVERVLLDRAARKRRSMAFAAD